MSLILMRTSGILEIQITGSTKPASSYAGWKMRLRDATPLHHLLYSQALWPQYCKLRTLGFYQSSKSYLKPQTWFLN